MPCGVSIYEITGTTFALCWISKAGEICPLIALNLFALNFTVWTLFPITWRSLDSTEIKLDSFFLCFFAICKTAPIFFSLRAVPSPCTMEVFPGASSLLSPPGAVKGGADHLPPHSEGKEPAQGIAGTSSKSSMWYKMIIAQKTHNLPLRRDREKTPNVRNGWPFLSVVRKSLDIVW